MSLIPRSGRGKGGGEGGGPSLERAHNHTQPPPYVLLCVQVLWVPEEGNTSLIFHKVGQPLFSPLCHKTHV